MLNDKVLLKCVSCSAVNRVEKDKIKQAVCGKCGSQLIFPVVPVIGSTANFNKEVIEWPGAVLVEFWSPGCVFCRGLVSVLEQIAAEKAGLLKVLTINIEENQQLAVNYNIQSVPNMLLFNQGEKKDQLTGVHSKEHITGWINYYLQL